MNNENRDGLVINDNNNLENSIRRDSLVNENKYDQPLEKHGIAPIDRSFENEMPPVSRNRLVRRRVMGNNNISSGFSSIRFIVTTLLFSLVAGILIGYLIIR